MVNKTLCSILLIISTIAILACLVINFEAWIVYLVAIIGIPLGFYLLVYLPWQNLDWKMKKKG